MLKTLKEIEKEMNKQTKKMRRMFVWPESVPSLKHRDFCIGEWDYGRKHCMGGWIAEMFILKNKPFLDALYEYEKDQTAKDCSSPILQALIGCKAKSYYCVEDLLQLLPDRIMATFLRVGKKVFGDMYDEKFLKELGCLTLYSNKVDAIIELNDAPNEVGESPHSEHYPLLNKSDYESDYLHLAKTRLAKVWNDSLTALGY